MSHRFQNISVRRVWSGRLAVLFGAIFTAASISSAEPDAPAADPKAPDGSKLVHLTLISDKATIAPGGSATIGVRLQMEPGWHTYWKNPGDSGTSTSVQFKLTGVDGATVGGLEWPVPQRHISPGDILDYIYEKEVVLTAPLTIPASAKAGDTITLHADVSWLVCQKICLPGDGKADITLKVGSPEQASSSANLVKASQQHQPLAAAIAANQHGLVAGKTPNPPRWDGKVLVIEFAGPGEARFYPYLSDDIATPTDPITSCVSQVKGGTGQLRITFDADQAGKKVSGVVEVTPAKGKWSAWEIEVPGFSQ